MKEVYPRTRKKRCQSTLLGYPVLVYYAPPIDNEKRLCPTSSRGKACEDRWSPEPRRTARAHLTMNPTLDKSRELHGFIDSVREPSPTRCHERIHSQGKMGISTNPTRDGQNRYVMTHCRNSRGVVASKDRAIAYGTNSRCSMATMHAPLARYGRACT